MKAIQVKFLPASNVKGARLKAKVDGGSVTIPYDDEDGSGEAPFRKAADALRMKLGWTNPEYGRLVGGQLSDGSYVFVFVPGGGAYTGEAMDFHDRHKRNPRRFRRRRV